METRTTTIKTKPFSTNRLVLHSALFLVLIISLGSCINPDYYPCIRGTGETVEEIRTGSPFSGIDMSTHAQVFISQGESYHVSVVAPFNLQPHIITRHAGNNLILENDRCIRNRINEIQVFITMPDVQRLNIAGSGTINLQDEWDTENLSLTVSGSGKISGTFFARNINTRISGSGDVNISGSTLNHKISISGSGKVNSFSLLCEDADVRISGSGHAYVQAEESLYAKISGSGNVFYKGNPTVNASISGTGKIIRK